MKDLLILLKVIYIALNCPHATADTRHKCGRVRGSK